MFKQSLIGLATLVSLALAPATAQATPFELITAGDVEVSAGGGTSHNFTAWVWITPQAGHTLTDLEIEAGTLDVSFSNPSITATAGSLSTPQTFTLNPGEFAGNRVEFATTDNSVYDDELLLGETRPNSLFFQIRLQTPTPNYAGSGVLDGTFELGTDIASFSIDVDFLAAGMSYNALTSQRIASVPEPGTAALTSLGLLALAARRRSQH